MGTIKRTFANNLTGTGKLSATNLDSNIPANNIADASVTNVTTLPESLGQAIKSVAGNPPSQAIGDIWYNTITGTLKNYVTVASAFSSGGTRNDGQNDGGGAGVLTAGLAFGGTRNPNSPNVGGLATQTQSEEYNGSSWSEGGAMSQGRATFGGLGTQTAALAFGGRITNNPFTYTNATEEYNGSSWTSGGNLGSTSYYMSRSGGGTQTAGVKVGGINNIPGTANEKETEEYDGSSWTTVNNMLANSRRTVYLGTQTAGIIASGGPPGPGNAAAYNYDGTTWTSNPAGPNSSLSGRVGVGTASVGLLIGGNPYSSTAFISELWNGTVFSNDASLSLRQNASQSSCSATGPVAGYITSGSNLSTPGSALTTTQEYTGAFNAIKTVTTS